MSLFALALGFWILIAAVAGAIALATLPIWEWILDLGDRPSASEREVADRLGYLHRDHVDAVAPVTRPALSTTRAPSACQHSGARDNERMFDEQSIPRAPRP